MVARLGYTAAFLIDAATFAVCLLMVGVVPEAALGGPAETGSEKPARSTGGQMAAVRRLRMVPGLTAVAAIRMADAAGSSSHNAALPVYSASVSPASPAQFVGRFWACWAIGNLLAQQGMRLCLKRTHLVIGDRGFAITTIFMSTGFILAFAGFPAAAVAVLAASAGAANGVTEVTYTCRLQDVPSADRSYAFGLSATGESTAFGLGALITAALMKHFSILSIVAGAHGCAIVIALVLLISIARRGNQGSCQKIAS